MNRYAYFDDTTLTHDHEDDARRLAAFMHEVWPAFWCGPCWPAGMLIDKAAKKELAELARTSNARNYRTVQSIIVSPSFKAMSPIEKEYGVSAAERDRFSKERYYLDDGTVRATERRILGWAWLRKSVALGLAEGNGVGFRKYIKVCNAEGECLELVWCIATAAHIADAAVQRWLWCLHGNLATVPNAVDADRDKHFKLRNQSPCKGDKCSNRDKWVLDTCSGSSQFLPGLSPTDKRIPQILRCVLEAAYADGRFEAKNRSGLAIGQDKFKWDVGEIIGASAGRLVSSVEIYVADTVEEEIHIRPA